MARDEIINKLGDFLQRHTPITEECHAVYLMVEIRKILEHEQGDRFRTLKFYCDWTVHNAKDRITPEIRTVMEEVFTTVKREIEQPYTVSGKSAVVTLVYMVNLQNEMLDFFTERGLPLELVNGGWVPFLGILVKVLENQPINRPTDDIDVFYFVPAADRCVRGIVKFNQPIQGYDHYSFGNAY